MTIQAWIIMTQAQYDDATALDDDEAKLGAREIDNPLADSLGQGALVGAWVAPARLLDDADYMRWREILGSLSIAIMDSDAIFVPAEGW